MKYVKRYWDESTGEIWTNYWGTSTFYFELDDDGTVLRQVQEFERQQYLKYELDYPDDKLGALTEVPIDPTELDFKEIPQALFEEKWANKHYQLFPEIVMTEGVVGGSPRIDNTRLTVGDVVRIVDMDGLQTVTEDFERTLLEVRQALSYCAKLQCKEDQPLAFCHNCTLRVKQDGDEVDEEEDHWMNAAVLLERYF